MTITRDFKLRLNDGSSSPLMIRANQYDSGEIWRFTLFDEDGVKYIPSSAIILGTTMSGTLVTRDATIKDDKVIVEESRSMTQSPGLNLFELVIDGGSHGTANFIVAVEPRPNKVFLSENDLQTMEKAIEAGASVGDIKTQVEANTSAIESEKTARQNEDSALHSEIESVRSAVGSPLVASTAAEMTNTNKVYVYTGSETGYTAGDWYYYNGSAWVDGGVYNSVAFNTDKTLSVEGSAADAKKTGDAVSGLNSDLIASLRQVKPTYVLGNITDNGNDVESTNRARTGFVKICNGSQIKIKCVHKEGIYFDILAYDTEKKFVKLLHDSWTTLLANGEAYTETTDFVGYVRIAVRVRYDRTITDEIIQELEESTYVNVIGDLNLYENVEGLTKKIDDLTGSTNEYGVFGKEYFDTFVSAIPSEDITFAIQTDTHCAFTNGYPKSFENLKNAVTLSKMTDLNCILHLGDLVNGWTNLPNQMRDIAYAIDIYNKANTKVLNLMGNHDDNSWYSAEKGAKIASECVTQSIWERLVMEKMSNIVRFPDRRYFSFDIPDKKTRIICLDTSDLDYTAKNADGKLVYVGQYNYLIRQEQLDWFINSLKSRSDWRYIICSHVALNADNLFNVSVITGVIEAFKNKTTYTGTSKRNGITISADVDFTGSESAGILVGCFAGHAHEDTLDTVNGVTYVKTNCSMVKTDSSTETRKTTDNTSDVIDVVSVNYSTRKVTLKRFGYGSDREFTF